MNWFPKRRKGGFWSGSMRVPFLGRLHYGYEHGGGAMFMPGGLAMQTSLVADVFDASGRLLLHRHLGSGLVTNVGVDLMSYDYTLATAPTLKVMNYHAIGTGTTAAAATDYYLQTAIASSSLTGSTHGYMTGTQSEVGPNIYQTVATFTANATLAVTEWGLFMSNASPFTGSTSTATSATSLTDSSASFTTSGNGLTGWAVEIASSATNTSSTTWGLVTSNTGTVLTIPAWLTLANAGASTPTSSGSNYVVYPAIWDHKVFSALNLVATNTLQITYQVTINSGG